MYYSFWLFDFHDSNFFITFLLSQSEKAHIILNFAHYFSNNKNKYESKNNCCTTKKNDFNIIQPQECSRKNDHHEICFSPTP